MDGVVSIVGWVLFIGAAITLVLHLIIDVLGALKKLGASTGQVSTESLTGIGDLLEKLPERYFAATIVMLVGLALADPTTFGRIWDTLFGTEAPAA